MKRPSGDHVGWKTRWNPSAKRCSVLFTLGSADIASWDDASIAVLSLATGEYRVVLKGGTHARYSPSGHLIYARTDTLVARRSTSRHSM